MPPSEWNRAEDGQSHDADPTTAKKHGGNAGRGNTKGRGGRGRGRGYSAYSGRGRGRGSSESGRGRSSNKTRRPPKMKLVTSDFPSMHEKCGAARYKVHKPGCSCSKLKKARSALLTTSGGNDDNKAHDSSPSNPDRTKEQLDGLVVIPETTTRLSPFIYICLDTGVDEFRRDSFAAEKKLRSELFPPSSSSSSETVSFKASCASCLLQHESNGFVCVSSLSRQTIDFARDLARKRADEKRIEGELHADHAHFVCNLSKCTLWNFLDKARTRQQKLIAADQVLEQLLQQGAPAKSGENVEFGHHLSSLLLLSKFSDSDTTTHWLTLVYDDRENGEKKEPCWTIDLPGGKRHLGETTFQGAVRETEEETSLQIDEKWKLEENPRRNRHGSDQSNAYYFLTPPCEMLLENITGNEFWQTPGL